MIIENEKFLKNLILLFINLGHHAGEKTSFRSIEKTDREPQNIKDNQQFMNKEWFLTGHLQNYSFSKPF